MTNSSPTKVLVTGASGFLGTRIVQSLHRSGHDISAFVRPTSNVSALNQLGVTVAYGDIADIDSLRLAAEDADVIVHAAADTEGTEVGGREVTVGGTRNIIELASAPHIRKVVYISSCSVYATANAGSGDVIDEGFMLEPNPAARGPYSQYKLEAENLVTKFMAEGDVPIVCLRPGAVYGPGTADFPPMLGFAVSGRYFLVIGNGAIAPPWTHVENVADAVVLSVDSPAADNRVFNIVDPESISKKQYVQQLLEKLHPRARTVYVPYALIYSATTLQEFLFNLLRKKPFLTRYRLKASQCPATIDGSRICETLNWTPAIRFSDAVRNWEQVSHSGQTPGKRE